ncbi:UDP-N-acetylmuramate--alanine ligase [Actinopolymorpha cephalotaxi]|uniref:UDP-N-acetylmuramate--L-alanine ligase n=1 Tax=Actinopolymorpha cephalotaxi TaxID=504797 RepID=A0A1I2W966_9ACTN|nr:UDP-N-acetylmuramate--L-alanine ligase [Actinopolymorpha cephalotaxi]NYH82687.1 UDP-N-acetylmuramate--alanine ligase [Actinopolymorpha cephalotaxi]SFG97930.1 UDP-N-acetylmuramate--alanine ligase [Actinopolymorpha cephalotaxi]
MIVPPPSELIPAEKLGRVHFVGIGGAGLSGIARIMIARGITVTGSDAKDSRTLTALRALGATCYVGHDPAYVADVDTVVVSTAIKENNPEVVEARRRGLLLYSRAAALSAVMEGRRVAAVSGAHGKTTTSSMLAVALQHCGADPSFAIGGNFNDTGTNAHDGTGDIFVVEADESDRAFLQYSPEVAVVTNVDPDHLDMYESPEDYHRAFDAFVDRIVPGGCLVACVDDPGARRLAEASRARGVDVHTYGEAEDADIRIADVHQQPLSSSFEVVVHGRPEGTIDVHVAGRHHTWNAAAAYAAGIALGFPSGELREGLSSYAGTRRRFEYKGMVGGVRVYDDYGHHPTEMLVNLQAARGAAGDGRVIVCFRPLRHTRTQFFYRELGEALGLADEVVVMDPTGDDPIPGVTGALIIPHIPLPPERIVYERSWSAAPVRVAERVRPGDLVLTLGAPDVALVGPEVLELVGDRLAAESEPGAR